MGEGKVDWFKHRRDFLKSAGALTGAALFSRIKLDSASATEETLPFGPDSIRTVEYLKAKFGIMLKQPAEYDGMENEAWPAVWVDNIVKAINELPPQYITERPFPDEILLIRGKQIIDAAAGGYRPGTIIQLIPHDFEPQAPCRFEPYKRIFKTNDEQQRKAFLHEMEHHADITWWPNWLNDWAVTTGWMINSDPKGPEWINVYPEELKQLVWASGVPDNPWDDKAVSITQFAADPKSLPANRFQYLMLDPHLQGWDVLKPYYGIL